MGDLRRDPVRPDVADALQREVWPPQPSKRRPSGMLGLLAAALLMAVGIDTALWHHNLQRRDMERRALAAEERAAALTTHVQKLREELAASQQLATGLHDELMLRGRDEPFTPRACANDPTMGPEVMR